VSDGWGTYLSPCDMSDGCAIIDHRQPRMRPSNGISDQEEKKAKQSASLHVHRTICLALESLKCHPYQKLRNILAGHEILSFMLQCAEIIRPESCRVFILQSFFFKHQNILDTSGFDAYSSIFAFLRVLERNHPRCIDFPPSLKRSDYGSFMRVRRQIHGCTISEYVIKHGLWLSLNHRWRVWSISQHKTFLIDGEESRDRWCIVLVSAFLS
jgi:hypothetical protein